MVVILWLLQFPAAFAQTPGNDSPMRFQSMYPGIITKKLKQSKEFYTKLLCFETIFESSWFVLLKAPGTDMHTIALMHEDHPSAPPSAPAIRPDAGFWLTLQVSDAENMYRKVNRKGIEIYYPIRSEPWGQKRFGIIDPNGIYIDIVEQTVPAEGYWDKYMLKGARD